VGTVAGTVVLIDMSYERNNCMHEWNVWAASAAELTGRRGAKLLCPKVYNLVCFQLYSKCRIYLDILVCSCLLFSAYFKSVIMSLIPHSASSLYRGSFRNAVISGRPFTAIEWQTYMWVTALMLISFDSAMTAWRSIDRRKQSKLLHNFSSFSPLICVQCVCSPTVKFTTLNVPCTVGAYGTTLVFEVTK
jgi:hypothetical protein